MSNQLTAREKLFCILFASSRDERGSAARAGYKVSPQKAAARLLGREDIRCEIEALGASRRLGSNEVCEGLRRLAFGSCADAVRLMLCEAAPSAEKIEQLDLFNVAEIKKPKGGGLEIKFFDRLKALEKLAAIGGAAQPEAGGLMRALSEGAANISLGDDI